MPNTVLSVKIKKETSFKKDKLYTDISVITKLFIRKSTL